MRRAWWPNGSRHCRSAGASSSRLIHAHPPHISQRTGTRSRSAGFEVVFGERLSPRDGRVLAVRAVAPAVERAGETALAGALFPRRPARHDGGRRSGTPAPRRRRCAPRRRTGRGSRIRRSRRGWGISSSRHAICQTRDHSRSTSIRRSRRRSSAPCGPGRGTPVRRARRHGGRAASPSSDLRPPTNPSRQERVAIRILTGRYKIAGGPIRRSRRRR